MNENTINTNIITDKKLDGYGVDLDNFVAAQELTVEITLKEYRHLISEVATKKADIDKANEDKFRRDRQIEQLQEQVAKLKEENYDLQKALEISTNKEEADGNA